MAPPGSWPPPTPTGRQCRSLRYIFSRFFTATTLFSVRRFIWSRNRTLLGTSEVTIVWDIPPETEAGIYRIRYFGDYKNLMQTITSFEGTTKPFRVRSLEDFENEISSLAARSPSLVASIPGLSLLRRIQLQKSGGGSGGH